MVDNVGVFKIKEIDRRVYKKDGVCFYYNSRYQRVHIDENKLKDICMDCWREAFQGNKNGTKRSL